MKVKNVYPGYENAQEREKSIQQVYTELQLILYNKKLERSPKEAESKKGK